MQKIEDKIEALKEEIENENSQNNEMSDLIQSDRDGIKFGLNKTGFAKIKGQIKELKNIKDEGEQKEVIEKLVTQCKDWANKHKSDKRASDLKRLQHIKAFIPKLETRLEKLTISLQEEVLEEDESNTFVEANVELKASKKLCCVVQGDLLFIGTQAECEAHSNVKVGILELDSATAAKIEASAKVINDNFLKGVEGKVGAEATHKASAARGIAKVSAEAEAKAEATAKAMVDLTKLMVKLDVDVSANLKVGGAFELDLKILDIKTYIEAELNAEASANAKISLGGIELDAKASAEALATVGADITSKSKKIGDTEVKFSFRPKFSAFARAEAKASAAIGLTTGVEIGAAAAVGLRGTVDVGFLGNYTIKEGLDEFNQEIDEDGKSRAARDVTDKDLGFAQVEMEVEASVGAEFSVTPWSLSEATYNGYLYKEGFCNFHFDVPGIVTGPFGAGCACKVSVRILAEIIDDIQAKLIDDLKQFVMMTVGDALVEKFNEFKAEVAELAKEVQDFSLDVFANALDLIGKDLYAIDIQVKRRADRLLDINMEYSNAKYDDDEIKARLEKEFNAFNNYVETTFKIQKNKIVSTTKTTTEKVKQIQSQKGSQSKDEIKAIKALGKKTTSIANRMNECIKTKKQIIVYVEPNRKVLKLDPAILSNTKAHLATMEEIQKVLTDFISEIS